jgi:hypothetical protein
MNETDGPIFSDEYKDEEWSRLVGQHYQHQLTPEEAQRYVSGPRSHPFGFEAWCVLKEDAVANGRWDRTPELAAKVSASLKGHIVSEETRAKLRAAAYRQHERQGTRRSFREYIR